MRFKVLKATARGNLLLWGPKDALERPVLLQLDGKPAARAFETIARVDSPLFLAKPLGQPEALVGKELETP